MRDHRQRAEDEFIDSINKSSRLIQKLARLYFKDSDQQADFRQDVLINAWRAYPKFRKESKFSTWLYRIAINTAFHHLRNYSNRSAIHLSEVADHLSEEPASNENLDRLQLAAEFLHEDDKALLALYLEDLTYDQISAILGISVSLVGVRLNRLKSKLKTIVKNQK